VLTDLCRHGNLEDFMAAEGAPLSVAVKLDLMLQVASGLEALKEARVLWRDLKAKNLLVSDVERGRAGEVTRLFVKFTDWGTAVKMPRVDEGESRRRMTLHGPGTAGYIAPDTRGPMYDYQADMWAYLVWAASMCLTVPCVVDCQLEEALALLKLEKKANATAGHEAKVEAVLGLFEAERKVEPECEALFELIKTAAPWVDCTLRWTPEEAFQELEQFKADHALATKPGTKERARKTTVVFATKHKSVEEVAEKKNTRVEEETEAPAVVVRGETNVASSPRGTEIAETEIAESNDAAGFKTSPSVPTVPTNCSLALVDEGAAKRRAAAAELRARAERLKREAERLEAEAEAVAGEEDEQGSPEECFLPPSELAQRAARTDAALASARWVGAKVRKWFPVPRAAEPVARRYSKSKKSMLRVKRNEPQNGAFREGVIIKTRAAFVGTVPNGVSEGSEKNVPEAHDWAVVCLVRFEDGEEDELTLKEAEKCVKDRDERDRMATDFRISESPVDENADTEPVGSLFLRAMATKTINDDLNRKGENDETTLRVSSREPRLARNTKRAREAEETTEVSRRTRQRGRPPLGALTSNQVASRDVKSRRQIASAPKGALPSKLADLNETHTPDSGSGSGSGKRRGRKAPDWAVTAVEVMGLTLGCAKCRQSRYGCGLCRERAGICDPENPPVLMLPSVETETEEAAPSSKTERQRRRTVSRDVASASAAKPSLSSTLSKTKKKRKKDSQEEAFVNVGDISDVTTRAELKKRLPRGVKLGCSKCRQAWRGCNACRKQNGVWIAPASNWVARGASQSPPGAALALPAC